MTQDVPAKSIDSAPIIRIIKLGSCSTLTGKGLLGFQIGCNTEGDIQFRMTSNNMSAPV
jgi:hypothetical protein